MSEIDTRHFLFKFKIDFSQLKDNIQTIPCHLFRKFINTAGKNHSAGIPTVHLTGKKKTTQNNQKKPTTTKKPHSNENQKDYSWPTGLIETIAKEWLAV